MIVTLKTALQIALLIKKIQTTQLLSMTGVAVSADFSSFVSQVRTIKLLALIITSPFPANPDMYPFQSIVALLASIAHVRTGDSSTAEKH
jgi:hypothetical protein